MFGLRPKSKGFKDQIVFLQGVLSKGVFVDEGAFVYPVGVLPIAVFGIYNKDFSIPHFENGAPTYLEHMKFPKGITAKDYMQSPHLDPKDNKNITYLPIIRIQRESEVNSEENNRFVGRVIRKLAEILQTPDGVTDKNYENFQYIISEILQNAQEHARENDVLLFAQYYRKLDMVDICIADYGIGLRATYGHVGETVDDQEAIKRAINGDSSKGEKPRERGYGLRTSVELATKGYGGSFALISGNTYYIEEHNKNCERGVRKGKYGEFKPDWKGAIVAFRLKNTRNQVNLYDYLE